MAKKRKSRPKDFGDDVLDVTKFAIKANVVLGAANIVGAAIKK